jgi:hypothetical protein
MENVTKPLQVTIYPQAAETGKAATFFQNDAPSFKDVLDTINPLQHIPVISTLYQAISGDIPSAGSKIIGGALFGGPLGLLASIFNGIVETQTGKDIGGNIMAALTGETTPAVATAQNATPQSPEAERFVSASQRNNYNAYVSVQSYLS